MLSKNWILTILPGSSDPVPKQYANHWDVTHPKKDVKFIVVHHGSSAKTIRVGRVPSRL